ncbi:MAG TPA: class I SAM-dependent methyltransferase, partial [Methanoregula sp.]|nr:class I SAM-dependent methyltransferase [Methanoregula sp.]
AGGFDANMTKNRAFFAARGIIPASTGVAIDIGAGCGFAAIPLAEAGFRVTAVDFCLPLTEELRCHATSPVEIIAGDILDFPCWAGRTPELITCTGDTLTHLPDTGAVRDLLLQCHDELVPGGKLVLSLRDYSGEPEGGITVIPVRRDEDRIFLCRLEYRKNWVRVMDILYSRQSGRWQRDLGTYTKIRIAVGHLRKELEVAGFLVEECRAEQGVITAIAVRKS